MRNTQVTVELNEVDKFQPSESDVLVLVERGDRRQPPDTRRRSSVVEQP